MYVHLQHKYQFHPKSLYLKVRYLRHQTLSMINNFLLNKTTSGMALSFKTKNLNNNLKNYLQFLSDDFNTLLNSES